MPLEFATETLTQNSSLLERLRQLGTRKSLTPTDRMFFTEQLALLLETGSSLHNALLTLKGQTTNPPLVALLDELSATLEDGNSFSYALAQHPDVFDQSYVNLVAASESGGFVHEVLTELALMGKKRGELNRCMLSAFIYPVLLLVFSIAVVVFVLVVVFPKFDALFSRLGDRLPASTQFLLFMSHAISDYWPVMIVATVAALLGLKLWAQSERGGMVIDRAKLSWIGMKTLFVELYLVQSLRVLGLSLQHGVSVMDALTACRDVVTNRLYQALMSDVQLKVREGAGLAAGFAETAFVPAVVKQMIQTGEETGTLAKVMTRVADHYEAKLQQRLIVVAKTVEPIMLIVMGGLVGLLVASLILPIFQLSAAVR